MKKLGIFVMPLMAISFLASCGGSNPEPSPVDPTVYHTITFHSNDGSNVPVQRVLDGELATEPKNPTKEPLHFVAWYTEDSLTNEFDFSTVIKQDYDLYAKWGSEFEYTVTLESDDKLVLETTGGFFVQKDYTSRILLKEEYRNKYDLPYSEDYYEVTVNDTPIDNFKIEQVVYGSNTEYYVNITIPKELLGYDIKIKTEPYCHYLTFTSSTSNGIGIGPTVPETLKYSRSLDNPVWLDWTQDGVYFDKDETIYVKNDSNTFSSLGNRFNFTLLKAGDLYAGGNIMSLLNFSELYDYCFDGIFKAEPLLSSPVLPATKLAKYCYRGMFGDCPLIENPILPARKLAEGCYFGMFSCDKDAPSIVEPPELPATELAEYCYANMFSGCQSLTSVPNLPATTLEKRCYYEMFEKCPSLTFVPKLSATKLAEKCCEKMFHKCTSLVNAPELPTMTLSSYCYTDMFWECTSLVNVPKLPATTLADGCYSNMFGGCTSLTAAQETLPATTLAIHCYNQMFDGCELLVKAPKLPAATLATNCYGEMFKNCAGLKINNTGSGTKFFTCPPDIDSWRYCNNMFFGTGGSFTGDPVPSVSYYYG